MQYFGTGLTSRRGKVRNQDLQCFSESHDGKRQNHSPTQCFGLCVLFSKHILDTLTHGSDAESTAKHSTFQHGNVSENAF